MPNSVTIDVGDMLYFDNGYGDHYHVVVAESSPEEGGSIMMVYLSSTDNQYTDRMTQINPGEHTEITKRSWVKYRSIRTCGKAETAKIVKRYCGKVSPELLDKIQKGILNSDKVPNGIKEQFNIWKNDRLYREF